MKEMVEKVIQAVKDNPDALTSSATEIANFSLKTFNGRLLEKALAISRAIVDFEDELRVPTK